jgi:hypothetical protein
MMRRKNFFVRPNMLIAVSLPDSMLTKDIMKRILDIADKELVYPKRLRTLSRAISTTRVHTEVIRRKGIKHITTELYGHGFLDHSARDG